MTNFSQNLQRHLWSWGTRFPFLLDTVLLFQILGQSVPVIATIVDFYLWPKDLAQNYKPTETYNKFRKVDAPKVLFLKIQLHTTLIKVKPA